MEFTWDVEEFEFKGFEWNSEKATKNQRKHNVGFEEAAKVFAREILVRQEIVDTEERYVAFGFADSRLLFVVFTERNENIRIISARKATPSERRWYSTHIR